MVLPHEFPFDLPFEQPESRQTDIISQLCSLAWKSQIDYTEFRQVSRVIVEEERGRQDLEPINQSTPTDPQ